ncbi:MAG: endolytic transglycosylase MltG [Saprospiraceae bacterium]
MLKKIIIGLFIVGVIAAGVAYHFYGKYFLPNVPAELTSEYINIPTNSSYDQVLSLLSNGGFLIDADAFTELAERMAYKRNTMRSGRYKIKPNWSNYDLVRHLRGGEQAPVKVTFSMARVSEEVAGKVAEFIEADSSQLVAIFQDTKYLQSIDFTPETLMSLFVPNTYEMYWNSSPEAFMKRMLKEHDKFWGKNSRLAKAEKLGMTPAEVYTIASIVERETNHKSEKPRMAGVYVNRLKRGIPLQADPTAVFATRDFSARRVLNKHIEFDSPYNTYMYAGLPPGPISMASISSIDGVLNAEDHKYIYFCAYGDGTGKHAFAKTLAQHNQNARNYAANLRKRGKR